jgi:DNA-binding beta-propeller fold protein YncE
MLALEGAPSDLTIDQLTGRIWFIVTTAETGVLYAFDPASATSRRWSLPRGDYYGVHFQIKAAPAGEVWFKSSYVLGRVDPHDWSLTTTKLAQSVSDALPPGSNPDPSTWMSAISPDGDGVIVARNNVPHLERYDSKLKLSAKIAIPVAYAGAWDLVAQDESFLLQQSLLSPTVMIGRLSRDGRVMGEAPAQGRRILVVGGQLWVVGVGPGTAIDGQTMKVTPPPLPVVPVAARGAGDEVVAYDAATNHLVRYRGGHMVAEASVGTYQSRSGATEPASVLALAVDGNDAIWFFQADKPAVLRRTSL